MLPRFRRSVRFLLAGLAGWALALPRASAEEQPLRQMIDTAIRAAWQREKLTPAAPASDAEFLRRIYLDLTGTIPSYDEAKSFLADTDPERRARLIDRLLADPRFASHQADVWDLAFFGRHPQPYDLFRKREGFKKWIADQFARNEPYDRWVRQLLLAEPPETSLFYVQYRNQPEEAATGVSRIFLGTQVQCARCHDHPFEKWTQRDFYGMAAFFVRLTVVDKGGTTTDKRFLIGEKNTGEVLFTGAVKDQKPGQKGEPIKARFLGGEMLDEPALPKDFKEPVAKGKQPPPKPAFSRKEKLAEWVTAPDNPYFASAVANRVWAQFLGRGLVDPVDDLSTKNPPSHPELLDALTEQLKAQHFDLRWFIRELVNSETYQLSSTGPSTEATSRWYERARVRPLSAEELMASFRMATGYDRAARLPNALEEYMIRTFGEPTDGRGRFQGSLAEHLLLNNSSELKQMIQRRKGNTADQLLGVGGSWEEKVDRLFLTVLSRPPRYAERERFVQYVNLGPKADALLEEAIWVLINCAEFRFNH
jgi:hypothetical protein